MENLIGKTAIFRNKAHYPSLDGKWCEIVNVHDDCPFRYGVKFLNGLKMAVSEYELTIFKD